MTAKMQRTGRERTFANLFCALRLPPRLLRKGRRGTYTHTSSHRRLKLGERLPRLPSVPLPLTAEEGTVGNPKILKQSMTLNLADPLPELSTAGEPLLLGLVCGLQGTAAPRERSVSDRDFSKLGIAREPTNVSASGVLTLRSLERTGEEGSGGSTAVWSARSLTNFVTEAGTLRRGLRARPGSTAPKLLRTAQANPASRPATFLTTDGRNDLLRRCPQRLVPPVRERCLRLHRRPGGRAADGAGDAGRDAALSPIDMESQERIKAERKAHEKPHRCLQVPEKEAGADRPARGKSENLESANSELASTANMLREQVAQLKQKVMTPLPGGAGGDDWARVSPRFPARCCGRGGLSSRRWRRWWLQRQPAQSASGLRQPQQLQPGCAEQRRWGALLWRVSPPRHSRSAGRAAAASGAAPAAGLSLAAAAAAASPEGRAADRAGDAGRDAAPVPYRHGVSSCKRFENRLSGLTHCRLQVPEKEAGADRSARGKSENLESAKLRAGIHGQHAQGTGGTALAESHEPRLQWVPTHANAGQWSGADQGREEAHEEQEKKLQRQT
uniref:C-jun n=1 Tax=Taenia crassiceps TaxID=6207 RepID=Q6T528_9CEST|nr:c-jun [Taenia crassiceps]